MIRFLFSSAVAFMAAATPERGHDFPLVINAVGEGHDCSIEIDGRRFAYGESERMLEIFRAWPNRNAILNMDRNTPYRCIGGVIFELQRASFLDIRLVVDGVDWTRLVKPGAGH